MSRQFRTQSTALGYLLIALTALLLATPVYAMNLVNVKVGIRQSEDPGYPCPLRPETSKWAATDWGTSIVVLLTDVNQGDEVTAKVTTPNGRVFRRSAKWTGSFKRGCSERFLPILGTDAEAWQGTWRSSILFNNKSVADISWEVIGPKDGALEEYLAYLKANPKSARAHYQVGATEALLGQDALAESELKEAIHLSPDWWYPYLALGRLYQREGKKDLALENFYMLKGLLLGRNADPETFVEYIQSMLNDHLQQLEAQ